MIKLVIFDLDGVLISSKKDHFEALNKALREVAGTEYIISEQEHVNRYDGLPTRKKLAMLTKEKSLPQDLHDKVYVRKQEYTAHLAAKIRPNPDLKNLLYKLKSKKLKLAVCSNAIEATTKMYLRKLGILDLFDLVIDNQKVKNPKPNPEMYLKTMIHFSLCPKQAVIVEDSAVGVKAAIETCANVFTVSNLKETYNVVQYIDKINNIKNMKKSYPSENLNILIPMAGRGKRFADKGYTFPKPLIDVDGKTMIQKVVENINIDANYTFVVLKEHILDYNIDVLLRTILGKCKIVVQGGFVQGAVCSALLAKDIINDSKPLLIANSDQLVDYDSTNFMYEMISKNADGGILTFNANHPKWSYAKHNEYGIVSEVAEKKPISNSATVGIYYWKHGHDFVRYAEQMIKKDIRVNNEFYVCPVYNEAIADGKKIIVYPIEKMTGLGTPEDLERYLRTK